MTTTTKKQAASKARQSAGKAQRSAAEIVSIDTRDVRPPSKLDQLEALLLAPAGATIAELMEATGWQQHSVRGAIAGALKKRNLVMTYEKVDGLRRYHASRSA